MRKDNRYWTSTPSFRNIPARRTIRKETSGKLIHGINIIPQSNGKYTTEIYFQSSARTYRYIETIDSEGNQVFTRKSFRMLDLLPEVTTDLTLARINRLFARVPQSKIHMR